MNEQEFKELIIRAKLGDLEALEGIIEIYEPMIRKYSYRLGYIDEDLKQYIALKILILIKKYEL